jgi:hypothetical protein
LYITSQIGPSGQLLGLQLPFEVQQRLDASKRAAPEQQQAQRGHGEPDASRHEAADVH